MKNNTNVKQVQKCYHCGLEGFFCYTPNGANYETCPCCGEYDLLSNNKEPDKYDFLFEDEFDNDMRRLYYYCKCCKIIFELGCKHCIVGCTDDTYNCHFIKKWKDKLTNIEYQGMPIFDDEDDWFNNVNNVEVLEMCCPHNGYKCSKTYHENTRNCWLFIDIKHEFIKNNITQMKTNVNKCILSFYDKIKLLIYDYITEYVNYHYYYNYNEEQQGLYLNKKLTKCVEISDIKSYTQESKRQRIYRFSTLEDTTDIIGEFIYTYHENDGPETPPTIDVVKWNLVDCDKNMFKYISKIIFDDIDSEIKMNGWENIIRNNIF